MGALCALALIGVVIAVPNAWAAGPPELAVATTGAPLPLPTISPPPPVSRAMTWSRTTPGQAAAQAPEFVGGRAVVGLAAPADAAGVARDYHVRGLYLERGLRAMEVRGAPQRLRALAAAAGFDPRVRYVAPIHALTSFHRHDDTALNTIDTATGLPYEWTFTHLGVDKALNLSRGSPTFLVGVVDSGVAPVPDLAGKVAQTFFLPGDATSSDDEVGHGTFVSSLIAAPDDDGAGLAGFCGACRLLVFKINDLNDFTGASGIRRLVDEHVRVLNLSWGGPVTSPVLSDAISYAVSNGVLVVAAAGNEGAAVSYPAALLQPPNGAPGPGLAVGASDAGDHPAPWSNSGTNLSLVAPGAFSGDCRLGVIGAVPATPNEFDNGCAPPFLDSATGARYTYAEGTSFSAPEVAGIAALTWSAAPSLKSSDIVAVLTQTATRPAGTGWVPQTGWGVVNAAKALENVTGKSSADRVVVSGARSTQPAHPGALFQVSARALWADGLPVPSGAARCKASVAGTPIAAKGQVAEGIAVCQWRVPKTAAGRTMRGVMSVSDPEGITGTATFAFPVRAVIKR